MKRNTKTFGFTLIELLMVIAIIGILAGILFPVVGAVRKQAKIATSKHLLSQYMSAIQTFKGEYSYYPFFDALNADGELDLSIAENSELFYETLSARDMDDPSVSVSEGGNRRRIQFYAFGLDEVADGLGTSEEGTIVDAFGNNRIRIVFDHDNDGELTVPDPRGSGTSTIEIRSPITAYVLRDSASGYPQYYLYE